MPGMKQYSPPRVTTNRGRFWKLFRTGLRGTINFPVSSLAPAVGSLSPPDPINMPLFTHSAWTNSNCRRILVPIKTNISPRSVPSSSNTPSGKDGPGSTLPYVSMTGRAGLAGGIEFGGAWYGKTLETGVAGRSTPSLTGAPLPALTSSVSSLSTKSSLSERPPHVWWVRLLRVACSISKKLSSAYGFVTSTTR